MISVICVFGGDKGGVCVSGIVLGLPNLPFVLRWVSVLGVRAKNGVFYR